MANLSLKRSRDEPEIQTESETLTFQQEETKRYKSSSTTSPSSYNQILSILEEDTEEANEDLSSLITSLQQELSSDAGSEPVISKSEPNNNQTSPSSDEEDKERVIRHLLEASDDELGIPNTEIRVCDGNGNDDGFINGGESFEFSLCDGLLWEFEDETANYYTLLQSELFL